ncbi:chemotaxis protein [Candidatus Endobugula sertula]|uniref:protein-glutamate O-methyltransferase n=1 Tax=Candidatus Endobugula sertula TaxID=62101 RepID=A0A1D2QQK6_9GAMM|nr:chemotaxis protein [Candidatus Endobugula sertula]
MDFKAFRDYLKNASGITITPNKAYLVTARIRNIMAEYQLVDLSELIKELNKNNKSLHQKVIDAMTTNETFWFRDEYPYQYFYKQLIPTWNGPDYKDSSVRVWSAACSSGQEPYSLGILCEEYKAQHGLRKRIEILATDLSSHILDRAKSGVYDKLSIGRGLSDKRLQQFFLSDCENQWTVRPEIKKYIQFRSINLLESYSSLGKFDIIFCRNVLIYFTKETKSDILIRMHRCLKPNGLLCLGSSEGLAGASSLFSMIHCKPGIIYQAK